jgi:hypothetical protein
VRIISELRYTYEKEDEIPTSHIDLQAPKHQDGAAKTQTRMSRTTSASAGPLCRSIHYQLLGIPHSLRHFTLPS